jgi:glycosyltransferase involved in cell wall biosynthesis
MAETKRVSDQYTISAPTIIIDGNSTDETVSIALNYRGVTVIEPGRVRIADAINIGIKHSSAPFVAFLDADDLWTPDKLELQVNYLNNNPNVDGVYGATRQFSSDTNDDSPDSIIWHGDPQHGMLLPALLIRRESLNRVGYFNENPNINYLLEWNSRVKVANLVIHSIPETVLYRRVHAQNMTRIDRSNVFKGYFGALKLKLDQQRSQAEKESSDE